MDSLKQALALIDPETELRFFNQAELNSYKAYLTITNVSQGNIAYKVKTTSPRFYVVKPNQGIIDKGQKITIDITMILSNENKIEENKFLVQIAACELLSSETYQLQTYWDKLPKNLSLSYKLKVSLAQSGTGGGQSSPSFNEPNIQTPREIEQLETAQSQRQIQPPAQVIQKQPQREPSIIEQQPQADLSKSSFTQGGRASQKHEYEKAPDDEINQSLSQSVSQWNVVNQDQINKKTDEVKAQLAQVLSQKQKIQAELNELKVKHLENEGESYDWQQPDSKNEFRLQLIHLLITAIICLFIGGYLGTRDTSSQITATTV
eukprot:403356906